MHGVINNQETTKSTVIYLCPYPLTVVNIHVCCCIFINLFHSFYFVFKYIKLWKETITFIHYI